MTDIEKLKHMLEHWKEHNQSHVKNYQDWALKAESMGRNELCAVLKQIAEESSKLTGLFESALKSISDIR